PHWPPPDNVRHALRRVVPLWLPAALVTGFGLLGFFGLRLSLDHQTERRMAAYNQVVQMPQRTAHITITLP
ncbi:DotU family type IV/VI secretion system protein, partial [Xanthomonas oryzae pv. oryzae]